MNKDQAQHSEAARLASVVSNHWIRLDESDAIAAELVRLDEENARLRADVEKLKAALHHVSLCSQNSMSSQRECGRIAREALGNQAGPKPGDSAKNGSEQAPVVWWNGCNKSVPQALRFLAKNDRPQGGEERFNALHLEQLADEIERMAQYPLYTFAPTHRPKVWDAVGYEALCQALELCQAKLKALSKRDGDELVSGGTALAHGVVATPAANHIGELANMVPFAWLARLKRDEPGQQPIVFWSEAQAKDWEDQFKPGLAWLEVLYRRDRTQSAIEGIA